MSDSVSLSIIKSFVNLNNILLVSYGINQKTNYLFILFLKDSRSTKLIQIMSFEINNSWLNLTNQSIINENEERFNFKSTSEGL